MHRDLAGLFERQGKNCASAPFYARMFARLAALARAPGAAETFAALAAAWRERTFATWFGAPLLLSASLHRAVLEGDPAAAPLAPCFPGPDGRAARPEPSDAELDAALEAVLRAPSERIRTFWREGAVQTNEASRAVAWLLPAQVIARASGLAIALVELGCSAGLNLAGDDLGLSWHEEGPAPPAEDRAPPRIALRLGIDAAPLDVGREEDRLLLRASLWPGQVERRALLDRAIEALLARGDEVEILAGRLPGAVDLIAPRVARVRPAALLVFNTVTTAYLDDAEYEELKRRMAALLAHRPTGGPAVWVELETPRGAKGKAAPPAELAVWLAGERGELARVPLAEMEPHPRTVRFAPGGFAALADHVRAAAGPGAAGSGAPSRP
jgi:hypothetical protein